MSRRASSHPLTRSSSATPPRALVDSTTSAGLDSLDMSHRPPLGHPLSRSTSLIVSSRSGKNLSRPARRESLHSLLSLSHRTSVGAAGASVVLSEHINFALPPSPLQEKDPNAPLPPTPTSPIPTLLKKLGRSLSQSRTTLVRRVSGSRSNKRDSVSALPAHAPASTSALPLNVNAYPSPAPSPRAPATTSPPTLVVSTPDNADSHASKPRPASPSTPSPAPRSTLKRSFRGPLGRSKSEGRRRVGVAGEEERMDQLVRRTERASKRDGSGRTPSDVASGYFWSDSLGICWDGREQVGPDFLASQPTYSSNADFVPQRVVYASTLSTFPPRPPLKSRLSSPPQSPTLSPASQIIAEYRAVHGSLTPAPPPDLGPPLSDEVTPVATAAPTPMTMAVDDERPRENGDGCTLVDRRFPPGVRGRSRATYARSIASDTSSGSAPSETRFDSAPGRESQDSSTSLESMRDASPIRTRKTNLTPSSASAKATCTVVSPSSPLFALVDEGPVVDKFEPAHIPRWLSPRAGRASSIISGVSGEEDWRDCE